MTTSTAAKRACRRGEVLVDGHSCAVDTPVRPGQVVQLVARARTAASVAQRSELARDGDGSSVQRLEVLHEDDHIGVVVKPPFMTCQGTGTMTAQGLLPYSLRPVEILGALRKPIHAHRLDNLTGGLLIAAKTRPALQQLGVDFATPGAISKRYVAIVKGRLEGRGKVDKPIDGKPSVTLWEVTHVTPSAAWGDITTVSLWPKTGRTHQLRKHMAYELGTSILGDPLYRAGERAGGRAPIGQGSGPSTGLPGEAPAVSASGVVETGGARCGEAPGSSGVRLVPQGASGEHGKTSAQYKGGTLSDGTRVGLCLWAVELRFPHPVTRELLVIQLPEPAVFGDIRRAEAAAALA
ncbi:hypothetical protein FOA52_004345 [Chlamydomonas sp. UWO 241]|nr:hypothetical protein FOA52_004345 [Chlamydomonas sp. UWO 241]